MSRTLSDVESLKAIDVMRTYVGLIRTYGVREDAASKKGNSETYEAPQMYIIQGAQTIIRRGWWPIYFGPADIQLDTNSL